MTWVYVPLAYLAEQGGLISPPSGPESERSATSKMIPTPKPSSCLDSETVGYMRLPYGTTLELLTVSPGAERWIASLEAFPVKTSVSQENAPASKREPEVGFGQSLPESFAKWDRDSSSWKTCQACLLMGLESFSETWPRWGLMLDGKCYQPQRLELPTCENESLLLPTPNAQGGGVEQISRTKCEEKADVRDDGKKEFVADSQYDRVERGRRVSTPRQKSYGRNRVQSIESSGGKEQVRPLLATNAGKVRWATPTNHGNYNKKGMSKTSGYGLATQVGGKLNPTFVEWLMGWPVEWTALDSAATEWFRSRRSRSSKPLSKQPRNKP